MKNCLVCKNKKNTDKGVYCMLHKVLVKESDEFKPCCDEDIAIKDLIKRINQDAIRGAK